MDTVDLCIEHLSEVQRSILAIYFDCFIITLNYSRKQLVRCHKSDLEAIKEFVNSVPSKFIHRQI